MLVRWSAVLAVLLVALVAMPTVPAARAADFSKRVAYDGAALTAHDSPATECSGTSLQRLGVVCAAVPRHAGLLDIRVEDASGLSVGGTYYLYDGAGNFAGSGTHCNARGIGVAGAALVVVRLEAVNGPIVCAAKGELAQGVATKGIVALDFA